MKSLELKSRPVPINQKYFVRNNRNILSTKYRNAKEELTWEIMSQWDGEPLSHNVAVNLLLYFGDKRKRDIDAWIKILLDSMTGIVYIDDSQITELHVFKEYDKEKPRVEIQVL